MSDINDTIADSLGLAANVAIFGGTVGLIRDVMNPRPQEQRSQKITPKKKNSMDFDFGCRL